MKVKAGRSAKLQWGGILLPVCALPGTLALEFETEFCTVEGGDDGVVGRRRKAKTMDGRRRRLRRWVSRSTTGIGDDEPVGLFENSNCVRMPER